MVKSEPLELVKVTLLRKRVFVDGIKRPVSEATKEKVGPLL